MSFDPIVVNPGRLSILAALASETPAEFVQLRAATRLTDGNLATHARRLSSAGLIAVDKQQRAGRSVTSYRLTDAGMEALRSHLQALTSAVESGAMRPVAAAGETDEVWID